MISNKVLNEQVSPNILDRLRNVSNVYFDNKNLDDRKGRAILIRGLSTINGYPDPLIVLDNFPYEGDLNDINPDDIESITILKDATAASIWGAKSANGVIVITTKKGEFNRPVSIDLSTRISVGNEPDLSAYPSISVRDFIDVEQYLFQNNFHVGDTAAINHPSLTPLYEMLLKRKSGQISAADSVAFISDLLTVDPQREYLNSFYQKSLIQQYNLSLTGGSEKMSWLLSGSYNRLAGNLLMNTNEKKNLRVENRYKPFKNLELGLGIYYTQSEGISYPTPAYQSIQIGRRYVPYLRFSDLNGNPIAIDHVYRGVYTDTVGNGELLDWKYYPFNDYRSQKMIRSSQNWLWQFSANYSFLKYFRAIINYQQEQAASNAEKLYGVESFYTRDLINQFAQRADNLDGSLTFNVPVGDVYSTSQSKSLARNARGQLNFSLAEGDFSIYAIAGAELRESKMNGGSGMTLYGYTADPLNYSGVDYNVHYPHYVSGAGISIPGAPSTGGVHINRFVSTFANMALTYKSKYIFNGSLRRDASNIFGLSTNDKWNPFWSVGAAWNISKESFYKIQWLSQLKLRTTLGIGGNIDPSRTALPVSLAGQDIISGFPIRTINTLNNPLLKWEQSRQLNIALDLEALNHRVNGTFELYFKKSENLFGPTELDYTVWGKTNTVVRNIASMKGRGMEVRLQTYNIRKPVTWTTSLLLNYNESKVTDYFIENEFGVGYFIQSGGNSIYPVVGKPLYAFAAYRWGGLDESGDPMGYIADTLSKDYLDISGATLEDQSSYVYFGTADPKVFGSITNTVSYKSFFVSANISYRLNYYFRKPVLNYNDLYNRGLGNKEFENRWRLPGDEKKTNVPAMVYTNYPQFNNRDVFYKYSEVNVLRGDHARLEYINFGYSLQKERLDGLPLKKLTLAANIANLGIIWKKNRYGIDPAYPAIASPPIQYTISINAGF